MERDEWEDQVLKQMVEMFRKMGMDVDEDDLSRMMEQIQSQFENLGIDPEKIKSGEVKINLQSDLGNLGEMLGKGEMPDLSEMLSNLGVDVQMGKKPAPEPPVADVEVEDVEEIDEDSVNQIPIADIYVVGDEHHHRHFAPRWHRRCRDRAEPVWWRVHPATHAHHSTSPLRPLRAAETGGAHPELGAEQRHPGHHPHPA